MKNLASKGLSMSQASSISNLCNQRALELENELQTINNCSKTLDYGGKELTAQNAKPIPANVVELVMEKGKLHATQAFLMENIQMKEKLLKDKLREAFVTTLVHPEHPQLKNVKVLPAVNETWGWEKLTKGEAADYLEAEAFAAHIGKFIHRGSILDTLRRQLPTIPTLEWMTVPGVKGETYPMKVEIHHEPEQLLAIHEELAAKHREYEQKVNYFKAKVKNMVTEENARISNVNADEQGTISKENVILMKEYDSKIKEYNDKLLKEKHEFEAKRQKDIKEIAALRIEVHPNFQPVIDMFLTKLGKEPEEKEAA